MQADEDLMAALRAGERSAGDALFDRYREPVWRFFRRRAWDVERAADLTQETFLAVLLGATRYEPRAPFRSYLFGIAFNLLAADRRRAAAGSGTASALEPTTGAGDPTTVIWVRNALSELDDDEREMVMLREYEGLTYEEIATLVAAPVGTVRSRLFRARQALREKLAGQPVGQGGLR